MLLLADRQHTRLITQQCTGLPVETARLSLDPAQSQLLRHLLSKPGQLHLTPANMAQYSAMLPGSIRRELSCGPKRKDTNFFSYMYWLALR